jgi:ParB family chromosome partitioning protein
MGATSHERKDMKAIQKILLKEIDLSDETFSVNFMPDLQSLRSSIEKIGLIQPVLLSEKGDRYQIVCGFRRVSIFHELGNSEIEARVFEKKKMDDLGLFFISLHENLTTRGFNTVEKAIALDKLVHYFQIDPAAVTKTFLPSFSLEPNEKILNTFLSLARMEDEVKRYVLKEKVSRSNIRILSNFTSEDRMALLPVFSSLKLGENRLREMLALLEEISRRDQTRVRDIVYRREIQAVLFQKELTPSQKTEHLKKVLVDLRYPRMRQMEKGFDKRRRELDLPSRVSLHHQPFFEGKGLRIEFQFETVEEYQSIISSLSVLPDKKGFQEMLEDKHQITSTK